MKIDTDKKIISRIMSRGVEEIIDRTHLESALLSGKQLRIKLGIDPTSKNIHLGRAITLRKLREFQKLGHKIVLIIGDFTATIGDASDKLSKRPMLSKSDIKKNMRTYQEQIGKIIDLEKAEIHYNSTWLDTMTTRELTALAESFSMQQMLKRRNFQERIQKDEEISLRELLYPLFQGYDSVAVKSDVEIGGFDQLFNLLAGRIIQKYYNQKQQDILITQMLEGTDGRKMSSSWGNIIAITDTPDQMLGKVMTLRDELISKYFLLCTDVDESEIAMINKNIQSGVLNPRDAKLSLAKEIVSLYYNEDKAARAEKNFIATFSQKKIPENIKIYYAKKEEKWVDFLVAANLIESKSEAKRLIQAGGVDCDGTKIKPGDSIAKGGVVKIGKKTFVKIELK